MPRQTIKRQTCQICHQEKYFAEMVPAQSINASIATVIRNEHPDWSPDGYICLTDLNHYRTAHIKDILTLERGELSDLEKEVAQSLTEQELLTQNINTEFEGKLTVGARVADKVAEFGGSWNFIILFGAIIFVWITINAVALLFKPFDPYPFILLNLLLSCLAALQAPVIMMSQNRQESKDRLRSEHDYKVNLKAELEIQHLNEKIDHLLNHQWQNLLETQQMQMDMLDELMSRYQEIKEDSPADESKP